MKVLGPAIRIYGVLLVLALVWIYFQGRLSPELFFDPRVEALPRHETKPAEEGHRWIAPESS
jgi:hypothetical protein